MKTVAPHGVAEVNQSFWEVNQQRITPAHATLLPLAEELPLSAGQDLVVVLRIALSMVQQRLQLPPGGGERSGLLHVAEIEGTKSRL